MGVGDIAIEVGAAALGFAAFDTAKRVIRNRANQKLDDKLKKEMEEAGFVVPEPSK